MLGDEPAIVQISAGVVVADHDDRSDVGRLSWVCGILV